MDIELGNANQVLQLKQGELQKVVKKVSELEAYYNDNKKEKDRLDSEIKKAEERLIRAD